MKMAIVYDSKTGNTAKMAEYIIQGIETVPGAEAKAFPIDGVDEAYVRECGALIVGTPTYNGTLTARIKAWLETAPKNLDLPGKLAGAYATAAFIHGGGDLAIQCVLTHLLVAGMMAYSGGSAWGRPVIHLGPVAIAPDLDGFAELFRIYGQRMAQQAVKLA
ncbi:MAG: NAD(P)H-dependent oxidoreductase [Firmicutes bacterium]|nr:NAD(P)H-dependent oxidoreductase [Bacillota bacterium]